MKFFMGIFAALFVCNASLALAAEAAMPFCDRMASTATAAGVAPIAAAKSAPATDCHNMAAQQDSASPIKHAPAKPAPAKAPDCKDCSCLSAYHPSGLLLRDAVPVASLAPARYFHIITPLASLAPESFSPPPKQS